MIDKSGNSVNIVQLRNPWGSFEWSGAWGDKSDEWTDEQKENLGYDPEAGGDDGIFWMTVDDFRQFFSDVSIGKVNTHHHFSDVRVDLTEHCHSIIDFKVTTLGGPYTFSVS